MSLALNEDNSHFYAWHPREEMTVSGLNAWLDQYADTGVSELLFCPNGQRSNVASQHRQSVWDGFDPEQGNEQSFFRGMRDKPFLFAWGARAHMRRWVEHAWLFHNQGVDPYTQWISRCRTHDIGPWLSMRMNDVHYVNEPNHPIHDRFWKSHPEYRRDLAGEGSSAQCFDYGISEVRAYQFAYLKELVSRYDIDGFELDWMRNPFHFKPGTEDDGCAVLTEFVGQVRQLLNRQQKVVGHSISLGVRVPSRPETALGLGMDAATWARRGFVDRLVITPFFRSTEFDMPIERWLSLLDATDVSLVAGLELSVRLQAGKHTAAHNLQTLRGAASSLLDRGADQIYLFNFMDNYPAGNMAESYGASITAEVYRRMLSEIGSLDSMAEKPRRHVVTSPDVWAPNEKKSELLPCECRENERVLFRIQTGPAPRERQQGQVRLGVDSDELSGPIEFTIYVNGSRFPLSGDMTPTQEGTEQLLAFDIPSGVLQRGENLVEIYNSSRISAHLVWVEVAISDSAGWWPSSGAEVASLYPGWGRW
jgi:hypothetical protein